MNAGPSDAGAWNLPSVRASATPQVPLRQSYMEPLTQGKAWKITAKELS